VMAWRCRARSFGFSNRLQIRVFRFQQRSFCQFLIPTAVAAQVPAIDREALVALFNSTGGANWTVFTNWMGAEGTECTWYQVTCVGGHVAFLSPAANNLSGTIPSELGNLSDLQYLSLAENQLSGGIPQELGNLSGLTYLRLDSNHLTGSIPPSLGNLSDLASLALHHNQLSGNIPPQLGTLANLLELHLEYNQLTGSIPPEFASA